MQAHQYLKQVLSSRYSFLRHCPLLLHSSVFHFFSLRVILLALPRGRGGERDADHCRAVQAAADGVVERIHVAGQEALADGTEGFNLFFFICN